VFRPGAYVLADYGVDWRLLAASSSSGADAGGGGDAARRIAGTKVGEPFVLRVEAAATGGGSGGGGGGIALL
jgi:hypothetical protein